MPLLPYAFGLAWIVFSSMTCWAALSSERIQGYGKVYGDARTPILNPVTIGYVARYVIRWLSYAWIMGGAGIVYLVYSDRSFEYLIVGSVSFAWSVLFTHRMTQRGLLRRG